METLPESDDDTLLETQREILKELKRQNALIEEQLAPQRAEKALQEKQEERYQRYIRSECAREVIKKILDKFILDENFFGERLSILQKQKEPTFPNYMGSGGYTAYEKEQIRVWRESHIRQLDEIGTSIGKLNEEINDYFAKLKSCNSDRVYSYFVNYYQTNKRCYP